MFFDKSRYKEAPTFFLVNVLLLVHVAALVFYLE